MKPISLRSVKGRVIVVAAVVMVAVSGCGGGAGRGSADGPVSEELVVAIPGDIDNFDPHTNQLITYQYAVKRLVFSSLVKYDADLKIVPDLAAKHTVSDDATKYTFELDPDAVFQDGTAVDADAVIKSLKRAAGSKESIWAPRLADVKSMKATGDTTVEVTLKSPDATFLAGLTDISILAPDSFSDAKSKPIGSGPYSFTSWKPNTEIRLERFKDYFGEQSPAKTIIEKPISDEQVAVNNLYTGTVDVVASASVATTQQVKSDRATVVTPKSSNSLSLVEFNSSGKLADAKVRQALAHALDKDAVRKVAYGGEGESIWSPLPESNWAYAEQEGYPYNLDKARALLKEAGVKNLSFTLNIPSGNPDAVKIARVWQESLSKIGVKLTPDVAETSVWLDDYVKRTYDATWNTFNVSSDPHSFFDIVMTPHLADDFPNKEMQALVAKVKATPDQGKRTKLYHALQEDVVADVPVMIVQTIPSASLASPSVTGYEMNPLGWVLLESAAAHD